MRTPATGARSRQNGRAGAITPCTATSCRCPGRRCGRLIVEVANYRVWWPWLRTFEATALAEGEEWRCEVQPPVPYPVRFRVVIEHIEAPALVRAEVLGDVVGDAVLTLDEAEAERRGAWPRCAARSRRGTPPSSSSPVSRRRLPASGTTGSSTPGARQFIARAVVPVAGD